MGKDRRQAREQEEKEEKMKAIERLKRAREGTQNDDDDDDEYRNDKGTEDIFEYVDDEEYEKRVSEKRNSNFIVDDVDGDYEDDGEDVWDSRFYDDDDDDDVAAYGDINDPSARARKRQKLSDVKRRKKADGNDVKKLSEMFVKDDDSYAKSGPKTSNALNEGRDAVSAANYDDDADLMDLLSNPGESIRQLKKTVKKESVDIGAASLPRIQPAGRFSDVKIENSNNNNNNNASSEIVVDEDSFSAFVNTVDFDQEEDEGTQQQQQQQQQDKSKSIKPIVLNTPVKVKIEKTDDDGDTNYNKVKDDDTESFKDEDLLNIKYEPIPDKKPIVMSSPARPIVSQARKLQQQQQQQQPQAPIVMKALPTDKTIRTSQAPVVGSRTLKELPKDNLLFYWLDATDRVSSQDPGAVHFFGKVQVGPDTYASCCLIVRDVPRSVYFAPREPILEKKDDEYVETEYYATMKAEVESLLAKERVTDYKLKPVMRNYAFELEDIPHRYSSFLKVSYPLRTAATFQALTKPRGLSGATFTHVLGTTTSPLEALILKLGLKGPGWLYVSKFVAHAPTTWCPYEVIVPNHKTVMRATHASLPETIPMTVMGLSLKTVLNSGKQQSEVAVASLYVETQIDVNHVEEKKAGKTEVYSAVRKLQGVFPVGFARTATASHVQLFNTEKDLLAWVFGTIQAVDPDVIIGHNIVGYDLDVLLARAKALGEPGWSKVGRLRLSRHVSPGRIVAACSGRLICDTYTLAKEFIYKQKSYKLGELVESQLGEKDVVTSLDYAEVAARYRSAADLTALVQMNEYCAHVVVRLADRVNMLSLTKQLTGIAGNLWSRTLCGHRAERVEYLLLHKFHELQFIVPDKPAPLGGENGKAAGGPRRKKAAYSGGMVLDPVVGYYDKLVVLLDFKSLYPSLIQEYNVCFLTVKRTPIEPGSSGNGNGNGGDNSIGWRADEPDKSVKEGILPGIVRSLVMQRRKVRSSMTSDKSAKELARLGIQQMALKLVANSLYGCLGFEHSRFYARPLAELVTRKGRETLQQTVNLTSDMGFRIIYGDTDSVMLSTGLDSLDKAKEVARSVIAKINEQYTKLEIDIDNVFSKVLLLKKKNYACVEAASGKRQIKGLYLVRRDWCDLSKDVGEFILSIIMADSGPSRDERIESIYEYLAATARRIRNGEIALRKFAINKSLSKAPDSYTDAKAQYHVQAAKMLKERTGVKLGVGDFITYVICRKDAEAQIPVPLEIAEKDPSYVVDADWYLSTQVFPPISRLCSPIPEIETQRIAISLGLDPLKFSVSAIDGGAAASGAGDGDGAGISETATVRLMEKISESGDNHIRGLLEYFFTTAQKFLVKCPSPECAALPPSVFLGLSVAKPGEALPASVFMCPSCKKRYPRAVLENQLTIFIKRLIRECYRGEYVCTNSLCGRCSRTLVLRDADGPTAVTTVCPMPGCKSNVRRKMSEKDLYYQLLYLRHIVDPEGIYGLRKTKLKRETVHLTIEQEECLRALYNCVNKFIKRSSYHNVHISSLVPKKKI